MGNVSFISEIITEFNYRHDLIKKKKKKNQSLLMHKILNNLPVDDELHLSIGNEEKKSTGFDLHS